MIEDLADSLSPAGANVALCESVIRNKSSLCDVERDFFNCQMPANEIRELITKLRKSTDKDYTTTNINQANMNTTEKCFFSRHAFTIFCVHVQKEICASISIQFNLDVAM